MPPPSGASGFSGKSGYSGFSGYSGASATGPSDPSGNIVIPGSLTTGAGGATTGDIAFQGSISGAVHLRAENIAGTGIFVLPNTTGVQVLATKADLDALRAEILGLIQ